MGRGQGLLGYGYGDWCAQAPLEQEQCDNRNLSSRFVTEPGSYLEAQAEADASASTKDGAVGAVHNGPGVTEMTGGECRQGGEGVRIDLEGHKGQSLRNDPGF